MTPAGSLAGLLRHKYGLLIDFDGPLCSVFAGHPASAVAAELHAVVAARLGSVPADIAALTADPLQILRRVAGLGDAELTRAVADTCRDAEVHAVATATPTPGAADVLRTAHHAGIRVAIISNNSSQAVRSYLEAHDLIRYLNHASTRHDGMDHHRPGPDPHTIDTLLSVLRVYEEDAVLVGDSESDIEAGRAAGVTTIGYANKPGKRERLADADAVIDTMTELADALRATSMLS
jgi:phosphoglycolate phosphatase-like HAD superfamily hydrolase